MAEIRLEHIYKTYNNTVTVVKDFNLHIHDKEFIATILRMVFQNYALYPHMNIYDNMAFGLKLRKIDKAEIDRRVKEAAIRKRNVT